MSRRERRFLATALVVSVAAASPALLASQKGARPGCVSVTKPGFMGAQTETHCQPLVNRRTAGR
jgi:hypothetical protein